MSRILYSRNDSPSTVLSKLTYFFEDWHCRFALHGWGSSQFLRLYPDSIAFESSNSFIIDFPFTWEKLTLAMPQVISR